VDEIIISNEIVDGDWEVLGEPGVSDGIFGISGEN
jgi:hypothetical protein